MRAAKDGGVAVLAVCGGYQLLGESMSWKAKTSPASGLVDPEKPSTEPGPKADRTGFDQRQPRR